MSLKNLLHRIRVKGGFSFVKILTKNLSYVASILLKNILCKIGVKEGLRIKIRSKL